MVIGRIIEVIGIILKVTLIYYGACLIHYGVSLKLVAVPSLPLNNIMTWISKVSWGAKLEYKPALDVTSQLCMQIGNLQKQPSVSSRETDKGGHKDRWALVLLHTVF